MALCRYARRTAPPPSGTRLSGPPGSGRPVSPVGSGICPASLDTQWCTARTLGATTCTSPSESTHASSPSTTAGTRPPAPGEAVGASRCRHSDQSPPWAPLRYAMPPRQSRAKTCTVPSWPTAAAGKPVSRDFSGAASGVPSDSHGPKAGTPFRAVPFCKAVSSSRRCAWLGAGRTVRETKSWSAPPGWLTAWTWPWRRPPPSRCGPLKVPLPGAVSAQHTAVPSRTAKAASRPSFRGRSQLFEPGARSRVLRVQLRDQPSNAEPPTLRSPQPARSPQSRPSAHPYTDSSSALRRAVARSTLLGSTPASYPM